MGSFEVGVLMVKPQWGKKEVGALVMGASVGDKLEKQMMKPPLLMLKSVDHCSCVPAGVALRFSMALNALMPVMVPTHSSLGAQLHSGLPGQIPESNPEEESSDGNKILIQSKWLSTL